MVDELVWSMNLCGSVASNIDLCLEHMCVLLVNCYHLLLLYSKFMFPMMVDANIDHAEHTIFR